jgi:hypothetical protein
MGWAKPLWVFLLWARRTSASPAFLQMHVGMLMETVQKEKKQQFTHFAAM